MKPLSNHQLHSLHCLWEAFQQPPATHVTHICKISHCLSVLLWKRTEEPLTCDTYKSHHLTESQIAHGYYKNLQHMNTWNGYSDVCSINVFRKTHLDGVSYHIDTTTTIAFEILGVLIAFGGDGEEPFWSWPPTNCTGQNNRISRKWNCTKNNFHGKCCCIFQSGSLALAMPVFSKKNKTKKQRQLAPPYF